MKTLIAIKQFTEMLKKDKEMRQVFKDNIAMAFKDRNYQYKKEKNKKVLSNEDVHIIANEAAEYFLQLLCDEIKCPKGR